MNRWMPRRPTLRTALVGALAAAVIFPAACASASYSSHSRSSDGVTSQQRTTTDKARTRKPISVKVSRQFFGFHDATMTYLGTPGMGSLRLWDSGVMWAQVEPSQGVYNWSRLDQYVKMAHANNLQVTLVLGGTPAWAGAGGNTHAASIDPPDPTYYQDYVTAVMNRYKSSTVFDPTSPTVYRGISYYQPWNEPNIKTFWTGTPAQMAQLVYTVWNVRQHNDTGAKVLGPSLVTRLSYEMKAIGAMYSQKVAGYPLWHYVDATTYSLYPVDVLNGKPAGPEAMMTLVNGVKATLKKAGVPAKLPIWDSEINYGYTTGNSGAAMPISDDLQAAYVLRTYLLSAAAGIPRVFWYRLDLTSPNANTHLVGTTGAAPQPLSLAGQAYLRVQGWLKGTLIGTPTTRPCAANRTGTYTCVIKYGRTSYGRVYWNPTRTVTVTTVRTAKSSTLGTGAVKNLRGGSKIKVGPLPTLVRSRS